MALMLNSPKSKTQTLNLNPKLKPPFTNRNPSQTPNPTPNPNIEKMPFLPTVICAIITGVNFTGVNFTGAFLLAHFYRTPQL